MESEIMLCDRCEGYKLCSSHFPGSPRCRALLREHNWITTYTNADRIRAMSDEELADFLCSIAYTGNTPWSEPFAKKFCYGCPDPEYALDDGRKMNLHECEFADGKCPHGSDSVWWLSQPSDEEWKETTNE